MVIVVDRMITTEISVVIPTYNRLEQLGKTIKGLEKQTFPMDRFEVVVVSDGSTDGTNRYLQENRTSLNLRCVYQDNLGVATARNQGVQRANSPLILFLDDDVYPHERLIEQHVSHHQRCDRNQIVIGTMLTPKDFHLSPWVAWEQSRLERQYHDMLQGVYQATARQFYTGNASLEKDLFMLCGGFDPSFRRSEDVEFAYRANQLGAKFMFVPDAKGYHYARRSLQSWLQTPYTYGRNDVIFARERGVDWLLTNILHEFFSRHRINQITTRWLIDRNLLQKIYIQALTWLGSLSYHLNLVSLSEFAFSGIFNLSFYQGMADQLGGGKIFFDLLDQANV